MNPTEAGAKRAAERIVKHVNADYAHIIHEPAQLDTDDVERFTRVILSEMGATDTPVPATPERKFAVKFIDHIQGTNSAEWECEKCGGKWASPANLLCPHCKDNAIPATPSGEREAIINWIQRYRHSYGNSTESLSVVMKDLCDDLRRGLHATPSPAASVAQPAAEYREGDLEKFFGIDPDFTGGMATDDYVDELRGDKRAVAAQPVAVEAERCVKCEHRATIGGICQVGVDGPLDQCGHRQKCGCKCQFAVLPAAVPAWSVEHPNNEREYWANLGKETPAVGEPPADLVAEFGIHHARLIDSPDPPVGEQNEQQDEG